MQKRLGIYSGSGRGRMTVDHTQTTP